MALCALGVPAPGSTASLSGTCGRQHASHGRPWSALPQALKRLERLTLRNLATDQGLQHRRSVTRLRGAGAAQCVWRPAATAGPLLQQCGCSRTATPCIADGAVPSQYRRPGPPAAACSFLMLNHSYGSADDMDEDAQERMDWA